ncbi:hypothetical protein OJ998_06705 [Solirubrobacter taibaiensis]|nr:hypothetical protein [Solirubrobacter taibaiensis]
MTSARALSLLAALAAPVFLVAAAAGWLYGVWPATPVTFTIAALVVCGGPILAIYHVSTEDQHERVEELEPTVVLAAPTAAPTPPVPLPVTPKAAAARALMDWRDKPLQRT